jgi:hypothetical protein
MAFLFSLDKEHHRDVPTSLTCWQSQGQTWDSFAGRQGQQSEWVSDCKNAR